MASVSLPSGPELIDAAVELSAVLRRAKVEPWLRPRVIGAVVAAMYAGDVETAPERAMDSVNALMERTLRCCGDGAGTEALIETLRLSGADYERLAPSIGQVVAILERLNVRAVLHTDADFLGTFYEAFLRYGYDNTRSASSSPRATSPGSA